MSASHTAVISSASPATNEKGSKKGRFTILPGVGLVDLGDPRLGDLAERLAGKVGEQLILFSARMREGLLAASVAVGLEVLGELMESEVAEVGRAEGQAQRGAGRLSPRWRGRLRHPRGPEGGGAPASGPQR